MDKKLFIHLQGGRKISGVLRGYDIFLNLVVDDAMEETVAAAKHPIGTVVGGRFVFHLNVRQMTLIRLYAEIV